MLQTKDFSVTAQAADGSRTITYILRITEDSVDIHGNSSYVTVEAIVKQSKNDMCFSNTQAGVSCLLNGQVLFSDFKVRTLAGNQEHLYYRWTGELKHKADGSLDLLVQGQFWVEGHKELLPNALKIDNQTMNLTQIFKDSAVGASDANIGSNTTIVIVPASGSFTHSIHYSFGDLQGYILPDGRTSPVESRFSERVISFPVPEEFYTQIPDSKQLACQLEIRAYVGNTLAGRTNTSFMVTTDKALCRPLLSASVEDINETTLAVTGDPNTLVRYCSTAACRAEAQSRNGAKLKNTTVNGTPIDGALDILKTETGSFIFLATDSREYFTQVVVEKPLIPYVCLTCNLSARRTAPTTGQVALTVTGNCWKGNFGTAENTLTGAWRVGSGTWQPFDVTIRNDHTYEAQLLLEEIDYRYGHMIQVAMTDRMGTVNANVFVGRGIPVFDWGEDYFNFNVPVHFGAGTTGLT